MSQLPTFRRTRLEDFPTARLQEETEKSLRPLLSSPLAGGVLVEGVALDSVSVQVSHGLGREWRGFLVARLDTDSAVWVDEAGDTAPGRTLPLLASKPCTVSLFVF